MYVLCVVCPRVCAFLPFATHGKVLTGLSMLRSLCLMVLNEHDVYVLLPLNKCDAVTIYNIYN